MRLYHASTGIVDRPVVMSGFNTLDFGTGFYTAANEAQAQEFALKSYRRRGKEGRPTVNSYECDLDAAKRDLRILEFAAPDRKWLQFVVHNRKEGRDARLKADIVIGPVANDDVFETIGLYERGILTEDEAIARFKVKRLFNQYLFCNDLFCNDAALARLSFVGSYEAGASK